MTDRTELNAGDTCLVLRPNYGGRIASLTFGDWDVLCPIPDTENDVWNGYKGGSFPLAPFSNRIKNAKFAFEGQDIHLTPHPNEPGHALHGHGCFSEWSVDNVNTNSAEISYTHEAGNMGWPWYYHVKQRFDVSPGACKITISVTNTSNSQMPLGLGFHPFFPFNGDVDLRFVAATEWIGSPEIFPTKHGVITHNFNAPSGNRLWKETKTVCYEGFGGEAEIYWRDSNKRLRLTSDALLNHFIVHVPNGANYFCLEPVCHPTDGFNLAAQNIEGPELITLKKSQTISASMILTHIV